MRLACWICHKCVSNEVPTDTTIRAILICAECIEAKRVRFDDDEETDDDALDPTNRV